MAPKVPRAPVAEGSPAVLRPSESDVEAIARWYAKAILLAGSPVPLSALLESTGRRRTLVLTDGTRREPTGLIVLAVNDPKPAWATVALLAIATQEQRDLAAQAVAALEADLGHIATHIRAGVPADVGLAVYFWLRLGYRPVISAEAVADGQVWMVRDLDT